MKSRVLHGQLRCAAPTTQQADQDRAAGPSRSVVLACGGRSIICVDRTADALEALPIDVALVRLGNE